MIINNLEQDHAATQACNVYRQSRGMTKARNPYPWWQYMFAIIAANPQGVTTPEAIIQLDSVGVTVDQSISGSMKKVANQEERDPVARNYATNLPGYAAMLGLVIQKQRKAAGRGRPSDVYAFRNPASARRMLMETFPQMVPLINLLDKNL